MSLDDDSGTGGHLKTRLGPFADELTSKRDKRVSAIYSGRLVLVPRGSGL